MLEPADAKDFAMLKKTVNDGIGVCLIVSNALGLIKEREYYKADGFPTFEAFCDHEWGWTKRYVNQLLSNGKAIASLPEPMRKLIQSERAARELAKIDPFLRQTVIDVATVGGTKPATPKAIVAAKPSALPPPPKPAAGKKPSATPPKPKPGDDLPKDKTGATIPRELLPLWDRGFEAKQIVTYVRSVKSALKKAEEASDPLFHEVNLQEAMALLSQVEVNVERAVPFAVCTTCSGKTSATCLTCKKTGFISEFYYKHFVTEEVREAKASKA